MRRPSHFFERMVIASKRLILGKNPETLLIRFPRRTISFEIQPSKGSSVLEIGTNVFKTRLLVPRVFFLSKVFFPQKKSEAIEKTVFYLFEGFLGVFCMKSKQKTKFVEKGPKSSFMIFEFHMSRIS